MASYKGVGVPTQSYDSWGAYASDDVAHLGCTWAYDWGLAPIGQMELVAGFIPMYFYVHPIGTVQQDIQAIHDQCVGPDGIKQGDGCYLMGPNEPNAWWPGGLYVPYIDVVNRWPAFTSLNVKLVSPSVAYPDPAAPYDNRAWLGKFMSKCKVRGLRVDVVGVHFYGNPSKTPAQWAYQLDAYLADLQKKHGKPIWVTEIGYSRTSGPYSAALAFMEAVIPVLRQRCARYAWFASRQYSMNTELDRLCTTNGGLTGLGQLYASYPSE